MSRPSLAGIGERVEEVDCVGDEMVDETEKSLRGNSVDVAIIDLRTHDRQSLGVHCQCHAILIMQIGTGLLQVFVFLSMSKKREKVA